MESGGEATDDHGPGWVPVKKKHRSGSKFSVQSWAGGFSGKNGSRYQLPMSSVSVKFANLAEKHKPQLSKGAKHSHKDDKGKTSSEKPPSLDKSKDDESPPKLLESKFSQNTAVAEDNLEVLQNDGTNTIPKINWGDFDDGDILVSYPGSMHEGNVKSSDSENSSLVDLNNDTSNLLTSPSFSCTDFQESKSGLTAVTTNIFPEQLISLPNKEENDAENCDEWSIISQHASDNVSEYGERPRETCEPGDNFLHIESPSCEEIGMGVNFQVPVLHEVDGSGIWEVPEISEVSAPSSSGCVSFPTRKNGFDVSGEGRIPFKPEPSEGNVSELSVSPVEKLGVLTECQSPFVMEGNKPAFTDPPITIEESGMFSQLQVHQSPTSEEKQGEVSTSLVEESGVEVECQSPVVSEGNKLEVSELLEALEESGMSPLSSEGDESRVSESAMVIQLQLPLPPTSVQKQAEVSAFLVEESGVEVECQSPVVSEGNKLELSELLEALEESGMSPLSSEGDDESRVSESAVVIQFQLPLPPTSEQKQDEVSVSLVEESGLEVECQYPVVPAGIKLEVYESPVKLQESGMFPLSSEGDESQVSESPITNEKLSIVAGCKLPRNSERNESIVSEPLLAIGKSVFVVEPQITPVSEVNESRISVSPVTVVEPQLLLMSKGNELRVPPSSGTVEKLGVVVEPQVPEEYELGTESPVVVKKAEIVVESPLPLISKEADFRVSELSATIEKSGTVVEPSVPLDSEETELRVHESPVTIEKADLAVESQFPFVSKENVLRVSESPVAIGKAEIVAESELPFISEENKFQVSESPVTIEKSGTVVEPYLPLSFKKNESIVSDAPATIEKADMVVESRLPLTSNENALKDSLSSVTTEKSDHEVEFQLPLFSKENELRASDFQFRIEKSDTLVGSQLRLISKEQEYGASESPVKIQNSYMADESQSPLISKENELKFSGSPVTMEKLDIVVESHIPLISKDNDSRTLESLVTVESSEAMAGSQLPHMSEENELSLSKSQVSFAKSDILVESQIPPHL